MIINKFSFNATNFDSLVRNSPLDGLRGILALSVLVHHFYITYFWKTTGLWKRPESDLLNNFGAIAVSFFFLITGYLFISKIQKEKINWKQLYISRIRRIVPLYLFVVIIIFSITLIYIDVPYSIVELFNWMGRWILFRGGDLEGFPTGIIIAGVNWTLTYEWAFYLLLPLLHAIFHRKFNNKKVLFFSILIFFFMVYKTSKSIYLLFLLSYSAIYYKNEINIFFNKNKNKLSLFLSLLLIYCAFFTTAYSLQQKIILGVIFCFMANGFSFFGVLNIRSMKILGDISYSTYLIHGLILYILFTILNIFNFNNSLYLYYMYFPLVFLIVVLVSFATYIFIEKPFLHRKIINKS